MDKEAFLKVVNNVKEITDNDLEDLLETSKFYPYCQILHILIAKKYHDLQHGLAPAKLHKAAIYTPDRLLLKKIMEDDPSLMKSHKPISYTVVSPQTEIVPETAIHEEVEIEIEKVSPNISDTNSSEYISEVPETSVEIDSKINEDADFTSVIPENSIHEKQEEEVPTKEATAPEKEDIRAELEKNIKEYKERRQKEEKSADQAKLHPVKESETNLGHTTSEIVSSTINISDHTDLKSDHGTDTSYEKQEIAPQFQKEETNPVEIPLDQHQIIENFINLNPSLSRFDLKFDEDQKQLEDLSIPKLTIGEHLISENLAVILHKQGKVKKAIDIYEKLILKFPEKKAYFASCIEKIKNP